MKSVRKKHAHITAPVEPKPSEVTDEPYLYAQRMAGTYFTVTESCGKWLVFVPVENIDETWAKIKLATEEGRLGGSSKVATAMPNPNAVKPGLRVICVYTYDWTDEEDVMRVRQELRVLGITNKISYKADEDTYAGKYANRGYKHIAKYYA